jgi:hypothetical protein
MMVSMQCSGAFQLWLLQHAVDACSSRCDLLLC